MLFKSLLGDCLCSNLFNTKLRLMLIEIGVANIELINLGCLFSRFLNHTSRSDLSSYGFNLFYLSCF